MKKCFQPEPNEGLGVNLASAVLEAPRVLNSPFFFQTTSQPLASV